MQVIYNAKIVNEGRITEGAVIIDKDKIHAVLTTEQELAPYKSNARSCIDAQGCYLMPGVIDTHVHFREPGLTHKADIETESAAAAAGGVTTVFDMPNVVPQTTSREALEEKLSLFAQKSVVNYGLFFGITNLNIDEALGLDPQSICGYKIFLGSSTGNMLMNDPTMLKRIFSESKRVCAIHSEKEDIIRRNIERYKREVGENIPLYYHPFIRSEEACYEATRQAVELARETNAELHVCHISTARELELFQSGDIQDKHITAEACIGHLWFDDRDYARLGTRIKCNPAIKRREDRDALRWALSNKRIDTVATDHAPHKLKEKFGNALTAASGMPSIQFSLLTMLELQLQGYITLMDIARLMSHAPAQRFHIANRGFIRPGYAADLVLVDPNLSTLAREEHIYSKCQWSPFEQTSFRHRIMGTWVNGKRVYDGLYVNKDTLGQPIEYEL